jgi:hypothetical protein
VGLVVNREDLDGNRAGNFSIRIGPFSARASLFGKKAGPEGFPDGFFRMEEGKVGHFAALSMNLRVAKRHIFFSHVHGITTFIPY